MVSPVRWAARQMVPLLALGLLLAIQPHGSAVSAAAAIRSTVLSIGDGDTIRVRQGGRTVTVRLACIDAPEMAQSPYGQQARRYLQQRLPIGSTVTLEEKSRDRYGRTVAEVIGEVNINLAMVEDGQAFAYRQYLGGCDAKEYRDAEYRASRRRHGIWQAPGGITRPWDFRSQRRNATLSTGNTQPPVRDAQVITASGARYRCREIGSFARAQQLLRQGHTYLDRDGDGVACESLR